MHIECTRHIDASEPDESGMYEYYYEYDMFHFRDGQICLVVRAYTDDQHEAHFLRIEENGVARRLVDADLNLSLFQKALAHLHTAGKSNLSWLSGRGDGYEPVR